AAVVAVEGWLKPPAVEYPDLKPAVGEPAPAFVLKDLDGGDYRLADRLGRTPLVVEFGSASCPYCVRSADGMEDVAKKYEGRAEFLFVYCQEAHPDQPMVLPGDGAPLPALPQTRTWDE